MVNEARRGISTPAAGTECGVSSGASEFGDVAGAAERGWAGCRRRLGGRSGPAHVERDLRKYMECDILAHGFVR